MFFYRLNIPVFRISSLLFYKIHSCLGVPGKQTNNRQDEGNEGRGREREREKTIFFFSLQKQPFLLHDFKAQQLLGEIHKKCVWVHIKCGMARQTFLSWHILIVYEARAWNYSTSLARKVEMAKVQELIHCLKVLGVLLSFFFSFLITFFLIYIFMVTHTKNKFLNSSSFHPLLLPGWSFMLLR